MSVLTGPLGRCEGVCEECPQYSASSVWSRNVHEKLAETLQAGLTLPHKDGFPLHNGQLERPWVCRTYHRKTVSPQVRMKIFWAVSSLL